ncbi:MAG: DUF1801 domain-containing protein [Steroidobacteraceae bacterium]
MVSEDKASTFHDFLTLAKPELRPICESLRLLIASEHCSFYESIWPKLRIASYGIGPKKMTQHYAYIAAQAAHINLGFYHGASLQDPTGILSGSGKALRHIKIYEISAANNPAIRDLIRDAIIDRQQLE